MLRVWYWCIHSACRPCIRSLDPTSLFNFNTLILTVRFSQGHQLILSLICTCLEQSRDRMGSARGRGTFQMLSWTCLWGHRLPGQEMVVPGHTSAIPDLSYHHFASPLATHVSRDLLWGWDVWSLWYHCSNNWKRSEIPSVGEGLNKWRVFILWNTVQLLKSVRDLSLSGHGKISKTYYVLEQYYGMAPFLWKQIYIHEYGCKGIENPGWAHI